MAQIKIIDRAAIRELNTAVLRALEAVGEQYGVTITSGSAKFSNAQTGSLSLNFALQSADGEAQTVESIAFKRYAHIWGLKADDLGETFTSNGEAFRITGANPKKPKYCIQGQRVSDNKPYQFPAETVVNALAFKRLRAA